MRHAFLAAVLCTTTPALAQNVEEDYRAGVAARLGGDPARAAEKLAGVTAVQPANADAHLQLGLALLALDRLDEAERSFRRTLEIAPGYSDARVGLARVLERRGERVAALAELERVGRPNAEADALAARLRRGDVEAPAPRWRLDLDGTYSALTGADDWRELGIGVRYQATPATALGLGIEAARRFGRDDVYGEARVEKRFADGLSAYLLAGGTPGADFRPRWQIGAGGSVRLHGGPYATVVRLDARQANYPSGDIQTLTPGIEQYLGGSAWVTGQWINVFESRTGRHAIGWLARGDIMVTERARLFAGAADAPDLSEGVVVETFNLFGGVSLDLDDHHSFRLSFAREDRATGADRTTVSLGLGLRF